MKRLTIFILVLGLATIAEASVQLTLNNSAAISSATINTHGSILIGVTKTDTAAETIWVDFLPAAHIGVTYFLSNAVSPYYIMEPEPPTPDEYGISINPPVYIGQAFNVTLVALATEDVTVNLWGNGGNDIVDTAQIHIIPEPITLAFLGLGAIIIRRK